MNLQEAAVCCGSGLQPLLVGVGSQNRSQGWAGWGSASLFCRKDPGPSWRAMKLRQELA